MSNLLTTLLAVCFGLAFVGTMSPSILAQSGLDISSSAYVVIDADTGQIYSEQNGDDEAAIASLTKVFTTIEALERAPLDQKIVTKESDLMTPDSTTMGFGPGETFTLEDLIYGMLLPSGNDAAHAIARSLGYQEGDTDEEAVNRFVGWMNERAANMGLQHTHFINASGWGVKDHHSSVADVATFMMYALKYPFFSQVISSNEYTTSDGNYYLTNTNKLLGQYAGLIGGKTGYDDDAGYCLIETAERDGHTMVSVTFDGEAPDIWYQDNAQLLDYAFTENAAGAQSDFAQLSYRDPDAATILASGAAGGSVMAREVMAIPANDAGVAAETVADDSSVPPPESSTVSSPTTTPGADTSIPWVPLSVLAFILATAALLKSRWSRNSESNGGDPPQISGEPLPENG